MYSKENNRKYYSLIILVRHRKVERFHRIPAQLVRSHVHHDLAQRIRLPDIVEYDAAIAGARCQQALLHFVEGNGVHCVDAPLERLQRFVARFVPQLTHFAACGKHGFRVMMRQSGDDRAAEYGVQGLFVVADFGRFAAPDLDE